MGKKEHKLGGLQKGMNLVGVEIWSENNQNILYTIKELTKLKLKRELRKIYCFCVLNIKYLQGFIYMKTCFTTGDTIRESCRTFGRVSVEEMDTRGES